MVICDTHVLVFDALHPERLSKAARRAFNRARAKRELACLDISLWEMAELFARSKLPIRDVDPAELIDHIVADRELRVLPISAEVGVVAGGLLGGKGDPADRLIAAAAIVHRVPLISADARLARIPELEVVW